MRPVMGLFAAKNAVLVAAQLDLGNSATRLLLHMALECWDEDRDTQPARRYFAGRESSAIALGFLAPDNGGEAAQRAVKRAVRELVERGAIKRLRVGGRGETSEYELMLNSARPPVSRRSHEPILFPLGSQGATNWSPKRATF
jgi:hypothetical protein